jgi:hypothetical protein
MPSPNLDFLLKYPVRVLTLSKKASCHHNTVSFLLDKWSKKTPVILDGPHRDPASLA